MTVSREQICESASRKIAAAIPTLHSLDALVGLDGFVDEIIAVVDKRRGDERYGDERYDSVATIQAMGEKILRAAGQSSNYELVVKQIKLGGNGPIMANALAQAGVKVTYVGNVGYPKIHPIFADFSRKARVFSIAEPAHTDALEFDDGKLMLGKSRVLAEITWERIIQCMGREQIEQSVATCKLIAMTNWTMIPRMAEIWEKFGEEIAKAPPAGRIFFVDLADPEKRTREDIKAALNALKKLQKTVEVILGLNLKEATAIAEVLGLTKFAQPQAMMENMAAKIREKLNLTCVVIHPRRGAAAATAQQSAKFAGPFVRQPKISTGAGDHFNAGFCLGWMLGLNLEESLCAGVASSGYYVRTAASATGKQLADFAAKLPDAEE